jgi:membrane fusion protein
LNGTSPHSKKSALFRDEALQELHATLEGGIVLAPRLSGMFIALAAGIVTATILAGLWLGTYTRRVSVTGQLLPSAGVLKIHTPQAGVVVERRVAEGRAVKKGDVLFVINSDRFGVGARDLQADIGSQIGERKRLLEFEMARNTRAERDDLAHLGRRVTTLRSEGESIERLIEQQRQRLAIADDARKRYKELADRDYIAREQFVQKELEHSEQVSRLTTAQRDLLANQREIASVQREMDALRGRTDSQKAALQRGISSSSQELTELESRRLVVVTAPEAGTATLVAAELGQIADPTKPLVSIVPKNSPLEARLYAPSRTVGFVRVNDSVSLRHQAFPYQKFGQQAGIVSSIATTAVPSTELVGFNLPDTTPGEPVYAITVKLAAQSIMAYGEPRALQPGMRVDADILQETRKLYEWLLEPLYSISGRWQR